MTEQQLNQLDKCHYHYSLEQNCQEEMVSARSLLGPNRFDLYAILLYIDHYVRGVKDLHYAKSVYKERTRAITGYKFAEDGNPLKQNFDDYVSTLNSLIDDFKEGKYDDSHSLIPVDKDYVLIDGAHRVSCAAYFNKKIRVLRFVDVQITRMTSQVLNTKLLPTWAADMMALQSIKWHDNLYMLFLWPKAHDNNKLLEQSVSLINERTSVMYEKDCELSYAAIRNLMIQIYGHMDWVGSVENNFSSTFAKADEVWSNGGKCKFILVQAPSTEYVLKLKGEIRSIYNIGLASIHSTDNIRETSIAANAIYNSNSFHFLHVANVARYKKSFHLIEKFKGVLHANNYPLDSFIIDSSMVLAIFGVRQADDLDYYKTNECANTENVFANESDIEEHDDRQKKFYDTPIEDLILNESNYFVFNELKFVSLEKLLVFKKNRYEELHDPKDSSDIKMINLLLSGKDDKLQRWRLSCVAFYRRNKRIIIATVKEYRNKVLKYFGIYNRLKQFRDSFIKKKS